VSVIRVNGYEFPLELYYHEEHCWVKVEGEVVRIGFNDFGAKLAGKIKHVDVPFEGDELEQGKPFGTIESGKWIGKLIAPLSGTVTQANEELLDNPSLINEDTYGRGWIAILKPSKLEEELKKLYHTPEQIRSWIEREIKEHVKK